MLDLRNTIEQAARAGGGILLENFGKELQVTTKKNSADIQTKADCESEKAIISILQKTFPAAQIFTEEQGEIKGSSQLTFVVDPLDGSNNFMLGIPHFSIAIACLQEGRVIAAAVFQPILNRFYWAAIENGIDMNGAKLKVNSVKDIEQSTVAYITGYKTDSNRSCQITKALATSGIKRIVHFWSPALDFCMLANGKIEAILCDMPDQDEFHDFLVGKFMAKEGGAMITTFAGEIDSQPHNGMFLASNGTLLHNDLLKLTQHIIS